MRGNCCACWLQVCLRADSTAVVFPCHARAYLPQSQHRISHDLLHRKAAGVSTKVNFHCLQWPLRWNSIHGPCPFHRGSLIMIGFCFGTDRSLLAQASLHCALTLRVHPVLADCIIFLAPDKKAVSAVVMNPTFVGHLHCVPSSQRESNLEGLLSTMRLKVVEDKLDVRIRVI
ncbi:hypothetical protein N656DRAFT_413235 [Canariomyces notabilis]|uniref:Uncharacterized protein n=1 Tax=Canariomyces notabilis TaxID=2074819 RepID=A0AAN6QEB8_9PEZI|nr:hypothetical protein N656DRAFT_413235 [Canariomyces arenarius]